MGKKTDLESVHLMNHSKCMLANFQNFRQDETMLDVTLVCNGMSLKAHKLVLSACSPIFKDIFSENPCAHPIIILRSFEYSDLKAIIDFIYKGELSVPRERLMSALKVAEELNIRGLRRSEPNREKYEKLYNQVCGKLSSRKKRKRHRHNSSDSEEKECVSALDSDQNFNEYVEPPSINEEVQLESQQSMEVEAVGPEENSENDKNLRPVVLRVGDPALSNEESIQNVIEEDDCQVISSVEMKTSISEIDSQRENVTSQEEEIEGQSFDSVSEMLATTSQFISNTACSTNSYVSLQSVPTDEQNNSQGEQNTEPMSIKEYSDEQGGFDSSSSLLPQSIEIQQTNEAKLQDEGKRFICSKCDSVFTSRINFMRHKSLGHNNMDKRSLYQCKKCDFATEELDSYKNHLCIHSDKVPFKCSSCPEEFTSEELYQEHVSIHKMENSSLHGFSTGHDLFSTQNKNSEKNLEFRCSICFKKFTSKLSCQFHEKTCQGGN